MERKEEAYVGAINRPRQDDDEDTHDTRPADRGGAGVRDTSGGGLSMEAGAAAMGEQGVENLGHRTRADQARHLQAPPRVVGKWTPAWDAELVKLWNAGGSLTSVAANLTSMGFPVTRGAISGRRMRLGLTTPRRFSQPVRPKQVREKKAKPMRERRGVVEHFDGVEYLDLSGEGCKAVLEDRGQFGLRKCCGRLRALTGKGSLSPYCDHHTEAYSPPSQTKKATHGEGSEVRQY